MNRRKSVCESSEKEIAFSNDDANNDPYHSHFFKWLVESISDSKTYSELIKKFVDAVYRTSKLYYKIFETKP